MMRANLMVTHISVPIADRHLVNADGKGLNLLQILTTGM